MSEADSRSEPKEPPALLQTVDDGVRRRVATMIRTSRYASLASLEPETGTPMASRIGLATEPSGVPLFLTSTLTPHTTAISADARCSILVGEPGKGDPLAHPRVSITGQAERIEDADAHKAARFRYLARHPKAELYADFGDFAFWRIRVERASFNGGFGKAYQMAAADLAQPDTRLLAAFAAAQADVVGHMNEDHSDAVRLYAAALCGAPEGHWRMAGIDPEGLDLVDGDAAIRFWFEEPMTDASEIRPALIRLARKAREAGES